MKTMVASCLMTIGMTGAEVFGQSQTPKPQPADAKPGDAKPGDAKPASSPSPRAKDAEIDKAIETFRIAFDKGDAAAIAATFTPDAEVVDEFGDKVVGRDEIAAQFADLFEASPGITITITPETIKRLTPDTAIEEGSATMTPKEGPAENSRYEALYVKHEGTWLQARIREFPATLLTPHDHLKRLEWLVGEWVDEGQDGVLHTTCAWTPDGNFLVRDFRVQIQGKAEVSGTQRIGWDASTKQIKSWTFDTDGTHSEQFWAEDASDRWIVKSSGALADGQRVTATNLLMKMSKDSASWTSVDKTIGDVVVPDSEVFVLVRKPPAPK